MALKLNKKLNYKWKFFPGEEFLASWEPLLYPLHCILEVTCLVN